LSATGGALYNVSPHPHPTQV
jgi:hypothetical protein